MVQQFRITPGTFEMVKKKRLLTMVPVMFLAAIAGIAISYNTSKHQPGSANSLPFVIALLVLIFSFSIYRSLNRLKAMYETYSLTIDTNMITREQQGIPAVTIYFLEIREISKSPQGYIIIRGREPGAVIYIPPEIENYELLEKLLKQVEPFQPQRRLTFIQRFPVIIPVFIMGLMSAVFISFNKWVVGICGTILLAIMIYSFTSIQRNKYANRRIKLVSWWFLLLILVIAFNMLFKLTGLSFLYQ